MSSIFVSTLATVLLLKEIAPDMSVRSSLRRPASFLVDSSCWLYLFGVWGGGRGGGRGGSCKRGGVVKRRERRNGGSVGKGWQQHRREEKGKQKKTYTSTKKKHKLQHKNNIHFNHALQLLFVVNRANFLAHDALEDEGDGVGSKVTAVRCDDCLLIVSCVAMGCLWGMTRKQTITRQ